MGGLAKPDEAKQPKDTKSLTVDDVKKWAEIGDTYTDDYGVDDIRAKKINGEWAYVQLEWRHRVADVGFIFYSGKQLEELSDLPSTDSDKQTEESRRRNNEAQRKD